MFCLLRCPHLMVLILPHCSPSLSLALLLSLLLLLPHQLSFSLTRFPLSLALFPHYLSFSLTSSPPSLPLLLSHQLSSLTTSHQFSSLTSSPSFPQRYADLHDMVFLEASAKNNKNVKEGFLHLAREICEIKAQQQPQTLPNTDLTPSIKLKQSHPVERDSHSDGGGCSCQQPVRIIVYVGACCFVTE